MKAGEYVGADGAVRCWDKSLGGCIALYSERGDRIDIVVADLRPAAAALLAKADELETEYISLGTDWEQYRLVVHGEEIGLEYRREDNRWERVPIPGICIPAFRAGRKRGQ